MAPIFFEPLKIELEMSTPVALPYSKQPNPIHLDSLVIAILCGFKNADTPKTGLAWENDPYAPANAADLVPLKVIGEKSPVFCASVAFSENIIWSEYPITKKAPDPDMWRHIIDNSKTKVKFSPGGASNGIYRQWLETMKTAVVDKLVFECVGDGEIIDELLTNNLRRIGYLRRAGLGNICNISISESDNSNAGILTADGSPARMLPKVDWKGKPDWMLVNAATKAPYWYPGNRELCWSPLSPQTIPGC